MKNSGKAKVAQLVEHDLAKVGVAGSNPVFRSLNTNDNYSCPGGGIGRHAGLKILWPLGRVGSSPTPGTYIDQDKDNNIIFHLLQIDTFSFN